MREVMVTKTKTAETTVSGRRRREARAAPSRATIVSAAQATIVLQVRVAIALCRRAAALLRSRKVLTKVCGISRLSLATILEGPSPLSEGHLQMRAMTVTIAASMGKVVSTPAIVLSSRPNGP